VTSAGEQRRSVGMPAGMDGDAPGGAPGPVLRGAAGALDPGAPHRGSRRRTLEVIAPGGGTRGLPGGAEPREGRGGQGAVAVLGALATMDLDREALAINGRDLEDEGCMEPEAPTRDGRKVDWIVPGGRGCEELPDFRHPEDGGELVGAWRAQERQGVPSAREDGLSAEAHTAGAETHGRGGEASDVFPGQAGGR
jgi:hypothetical protein